ncbi:MAG TPA: PfkB family carbohydrate kinase [archaeon]|nr:PfkB family carbohydrate kinase [archaeon]
MSKIFCIGDLNTDLFLYTEQHAQIDVEKSVPKTNLVIGGNAANTAMALGGLKQDVSIVSIAGDDAFTGFLESELKRGGVKPLLEKNKEKNGISVIFVARNGKRGILSNKGSLLEMNQKLVEKQLLGRIRENDIAYFGGYYHIPKMRKNFKALLEKIKRKKAKVFFDTTYDEYEKWELLPFIKQIDVLFANEIELKKIAKKNETKKAVRFLLAKGAKKIVVKNGEKGAALFTKSIELRSQAIKVKAVNTTGAGDFFNAGFAYGKLNNYSDKVSLMCANFVAGKKTEHEEYFLPTKTMLEEHLKEKEFLDVRNVNSYEEMSKMAAREIIQQLWEKPNSVLALASGNTPIGTYRELVKEYRKGNADFSKARFIELDEYMNIENPKNSLANTFLAKNFVEKVNFRKKNILYFDPYKSFATQKKKFDSFIKRNGIDFCLLGMGENAHIAFNEPGTKFSTEIRVVELSKSTKRINSHGMKEKIPEKAITLGLKTIFSAKKIVLIASGIKKAGAIRKIVKGKIFELVPASILQKHRNTMIITDKQAGKFV